MQRIGEENLKVVDEKKDEGVMTQDTLSPEKHKKSYFQKPTE